MVAHQNLIFFDDDVLADVILNLTDFVSAFDDILSNQLDHISKQKSLTLSVYGVQSGLDAFLAHDDDLFYYLCPDRDLLISERQNDANRFRDLLCVHRVEIVNDLLSAFYESFVATCD